jgi:hypothetical protein
MTEDEWDAATEPLRMLAFLRASGKASDRKLRLLAVACCRAAWRLFNAKAVRAAVETSERYADGEVTLDALEAARFAAERLAERGFRKHVRAMPWTLPVQGKFARQAAVQVASADIDDVLDIMVSAFVVARTQSGFEQGRRREQQHRADLLRCLFGPLPFRRVHVKRTAGASALAKAIYQGRLWGDLPVLGDLLSEAGCADEDVLTHCRGTVHARGCWLCDFLLSKA